jgi:hypothetical protein
MIGMVLLKLFIKLKSYNKNFVNYRDLYIMNKFCIVKFWDIAYLIVSLKSNSLDIL